MLHFLIILYWIVFASPLLDCNLSWSHTVSYPFWISHVVAEWWLLLAQWMVFFDSLSEWMDGWMPRAELCPQDVTLPGGFSLPKPSHDCRGLSRINEASYHSWSHWGTHTHFLNCSPLLWVLKVLSWELILWQSFTRRFNSYLEKNMAWKCFYPQEVGKYHIKESCVLYFWFIFKRVSQIS